MTAWTEGFSPEDLARETASQGSAGQNQQLDGANDWRPDDPNSPANVQRAADDAARKRLELEISATQRAEEARVQREQDMMIQTLRATFKQYGLDSLFSKIESYVRQGYNADAAAIMLRDTPEYQARFPAMKALAEKGRALTEGEYIAYEKNAEELEKAYGLPAGMLGQNAVTKLLTNAVSADDLEKRVVMASAAAYSVAEDVRQTFSKYYGIGSGGLAAYFLDPDEATPLLNKQYVSSQIGAEALRQAIDIGATTSEELFTAGITAESARQGFENVANQRIFTSGRGETVSQEQLINANLRNNNEAVTAVERVAGSRVGAFAGGGQFERTQSGNVGLGTAATQ